MAWRQVINEKINSHNVHHRCLFLLSCLGRHTVPISGTGRGRFAVCPSSHRESELEVFGKLEFARVRTIKLRFSLRLYMVLVTKSLALELLKDYLTDSW